MEKEKALTDFIDTLSPEVVKHYEELAKLNREKDEKKTSKRNRRSAEDEKQTAAYDPNKNTASQNPHIFLQVLRETMRRFDKETKSTVTFGNMKIYPDAPWNLEEKYKQQIKDAIGKIEEKSTDMIMSNLDNVVSRVTTLWSDLSKNEEFHLRVLLLNQAQKGSLISALQYFLMTQHGIFKNVKELADSLQLNYKATLNCLKFYHLTKKFPNLLKCAVRFIWNNGETHDMVGVLFRLS
jgi:hypothetical protein